MLSKSATIFAILAASAQVAIAAPPACLLAAVSNCPDPSDFKSICGTPGKITDYLSKNCGDNQETAMSAFSDICMAQGHAVSLPSTTSSADSSATSGAASASDINLTSLPYYSRTYTGTGFAPLATASGSPSSAATGMPDASGSSSGSMAAATGSSTANGSPETTAAVGGGSSSATGSAASASASSATSTGGAADIGANMLVVFLSMASAVLAI